MSETKAEKKRKKTTRINEGLAIDVNLCLSPHAESLLQEINANLAAVAIELNRISLAQEHRFRAEEKGLDTASDMVGLLRNLTGVRKVEVPDEGVPVFGPDDPYDPEDDVTLVEGDEMEEVTLVTTIVRMCPNCGHENEQKEGETWRVCGECHHPIGDE